MEGNTYQTLAMRTNDGRSTERLKEIIDWKDKNVTTKGEYDIGDLLNGCLGLSGEVGEFNDMIKKWIFHEKPLDEEHLKKECSDIMWYIAMICESMEWELNEIMRINIEKLKARYPQGFDTNLANNRKEGDV